METLLAIAVLVFAICIAFDRWYAHRLETADQRALQKRQRTEDERSELMRRVAEDSLRKP